MINLWKQLPNFAKFAVTFIGLYFGLTFLFTSIQFKHTYVGGVVAVYNSLFDELNEDIKLEYTYLHKTGDDFQIRLISQAQIDQALASARQKGLKTVDLVQSMVLLKSRAIFYLPFLVLLTFILAYPKPILRKLFALIIAFLLHHIVIFWRIKSGIWHEISTVSTIPHDSLSDFMKQMNFYIAAVPEIEFNVVIALFIAMICCIRSNDLEYFTK